MNPHGLANILGRFLLASIFLISGIGKLGEWEQTIQYMENYGVPAPRVLLPIATAVEILGAVLLIVGFKARWAALALVVFLIPASYFFHAFWKLPSETSEQMMARRTQMILFMKNVAIAGGLIIVAARGAGPGSVDEPHDVGRTV
jgi:putative oxidoreductase